MKKNTKNLIIALTMAVSIQNLGLCANSVAINPLMPRIGVNNKLEYTQVTTISSLSPVSAPVPEIKSTVKTYNNIDLQSIAKEITGDIKDENEETLSDLRVLWKAAVNRSETVKFAIYKLSTPDEQKDKSSTMKKILTPLAGMSTLVGSGLNNSVASGGSYIGGQMLGSMLYDKEKLMNNQLTRVTDADLVILSKEIDGLQQKLLELYYNYVTAYKVLIYSDKMVHNREKYYFSSQKLSTDKLAIADIFYRESVDARYNARQKLLVSRAALEQFVGNDALLDVEANIKKRLSEDKNF